MPWWSWVLIWSGLLVMTLVIFARIGLRLWRSAIALFTELEIAGERASAVSAQLEMIKVPSDPEPLAVFSNPTQLRARRYLDQRSRRRRHPGS